MAFTIQSRGKSKNQHQTNGGFYTTLHILHHNSLFVNSTMLTVIPCEKECICGTCGRYIYSCKHICGTFGVLMNVHFQPECLVSS